MTSAELHDAAAKGDANRMRELLNAGVDPNIGEYPLYAPIHEAASSGSSECVSLLLNAGSRIDHRALFNWSPLHAAWTAEIVDILVRAGCNVQDHADDQFTPLHAAAENSRCETIRALVAHGADINATTLEFKSTPLNHACSTCDMYEVTYDTLRTLIECGADVRIPTTDGKTPLHELAWHSPDWPSHQKREVIELIVAAGADIEARDNWSSTPLMEACGIDGGDLIFIESLISQGAAINACDDEGCTALHQAVHNTRNGSEIMKLLLRSGADAKRRNHDQKTPLDLTRVAIAEYQDISQAEKYRGWILKSVTESCEEAKRMVALLELNLA